MKKILTFFMVLLFAIVFVGCKEETDYDFKVETDVTTVKVGETMQVFSTSTKLSPVYGYSSSDESIATVDLAGIVKGIKVGEVTITVTLEGVGEKTVTITVTERDFTTEEFKTLLTKVASDYVNSKNGHIKVQVNDGTDTMTSETIYNYTADGSLESLMYKVVANEETHVYVKEGYSYMLANGAKLKKQLTAQDETTIKTTYGHKTFLEPVTKFYSEDKFYSALTFVKNTNGVIEFNLDVTKYDGVVFNMDGIDEVKIITTVVNNAVTKVELISKVGTTTSTAVVEYLGTAVQTIAFPDLTTYK